MQNYSWSSSKMTDNLLSPRRQPWNIPTPDPVEEIGASSHHDASVMDQVFPRRNFSSIGGGDAPMQKQAPKFKSLFTISTRSVMASHVNVSYTTSTTSVDADALQTNFMALSPNSPPQIGFGQGDSAGLLGEDVKPINTEERLSICPNDAPSQNDNEKEYRFNPMERRCFHRSLENLHKNTVPPSRRFQKEADKNRRNSSNSPPVTNVRGQMIEAANDLLAEENKYLHSNIKNIRRKLLITKSALGFAMQGVKRRGKVIKELEIVKMEKMQQCAARLILHNLLLNSWRNTKRELNMRIDDNNELRKSVENFALQVQVLRHIQTSERQKSQEKTTIINNMNEELGIVKEENGIIRKEVEKMENKLNSLQASTQKLTEENQALTKEITSITDTRDNMLQSLDRERVRSEQFRRDNESMKDTLEHLGGQLKDATEQKSHWQERARCSESEAWELKLHLETRDGNIKELSRECQDLREDRMNLIEEKSSLKLELEKAASALQVLNEKTDELVAGLEIIKVERDSKVRTVEELEKELESTKKETRELERELMSYKLHNVRRRRDWGNALYFIASPMDAVRRKLT